jgi:uncharacterized protein
LREQRDQETGYLPPGVFMNRIALLLVLALSLPFTARADEASHRAKAQEMMSLLHTDKNVQQVVDNISKEVAEAADKAIGPDPTPEKKAKATDFEQQAHQIIDAQLGWKSMQAGFTDIYAKAFTDEQLDSIIAFYKSPAGIALLTTMPDVNTQIGQLGQSHVAAVQPQLQQLYSTFKQSLAAAPPTLGPTSPALPPAAPPAPSATTPK